MTTAAIDNAATAIEKEITLSVSEALRALPESESIEDHTGILKVRGVISSLRPVFKMIAGEYGKCPKCGAFFNEHYDKPRFEGIQLMIPFCKNYDAIEHPAETVGVEKGKGRFVDNAGNEYEFVRDKKGKIIRTKVYLKTGFEYINAAIVEIQDADKFDDLEKLQVILFDSDTDNIRAGEQVTITGQIYIEQLGSRDSKLSARLYAHSIKYEARREISLSNMDKDAITRFVARFGKNTITKLADMFAPSVIGYGHVKKGLLLSAASCANDFRSSKTFKHRFRMHCILVGDPGLAKSVLLKEVVKIVPNSRFESGQNSTGKSLTAIVSKEGGENTILRLGPIPFAKEGMCAVNELGRMMFDDQAPLLDVMEEGEFSINKYGINAHIRSPTVIVGSANPTTSKWSDSDAAANGGKINLDDIPAIKPLLDRFDLIFVFRTTRDVNAIREYVYAKSVFEDTVVPNYNEYLEKHIMYAKRFNPKISDEARIILNEYYIGIAKRTGSPRVRETIYNLARMIARLNLKSIADADDAREACQFYNVILNERDHVVNIPGNPRDITFTECLYMLEATQAPITFEELIEKVCRKDEYIRSYIGTKHVIRENKKLRSILEMMLNHSQVRRLQLKPVVLQWIPAIASPTATKSDEKPEESSRTNEDLCDPCDLCDPLQTLPAERNTPIMHENKSDQSNDRRSHTSHRSHSNTQNTERRTFFKDSDSGSIFTAADFALGHACFYCALVADENTPLNSYCFDTRDLLERHSIKKHQGWPIDPGDADKEKYWLELGQKQQQPQSTWLLDKGDN